VCKKTTAREDSRSWRETVQSVSRTQSSAPKARADVIGGIVRLLITTTPCDLAFAVDRDPPTGVLRDVAVAVSQITGVDQEAVLAEVVTARVYQKPRFLVLA
jgi:hypothetical protein